jgi:segregation and condensation protein B
MEVRMSAVELRDTEQAAQDVTTLEQEPESGQPPLHHGATASATQQDGLAGRELVGVLEALLFVSPEPVPVTRLATVIGTAKSEVEQALKVLEEELGQDSRGIQLVKLAGGYRLVTKSDYAPWLKRLDKAKAAQKLSRSALESLAIIAYKQPLVRAEIEEIRGVETSGVLRTLLERKLVRIVGRKEVPGRPIMYGTTKFFLEHFGLQDLTQLPPLREFKELGEAEQAQLPIEDVTMFPDGSTEEGVSETVTESPELAADEGHTLLVS